MYRAPFTMPISSTELTTTTPTLTSKETEMALNKLFRSPFTVPMASSDLLSNAKSSAPQTSCVVSVTCQDRRPYLSVANDDSKTCACACFVARDSFHSPLHDCDAISPLAGGLKPSAGHPGSSLPPGLDSSAFCAPLLRGLPIRTERLMRCVTSAGQPLTYDPALVAHPYSLLYSGFDLNSLGIRKAATRETTGPLKAWLNEHRKNPYPTKAEKIMLAIITKMTLTQVSTWFANARRRLKKESRIHSSRTNSGSQKNDAECGKGDDDDSEEMREESFAMQEHYDCEEDINVDISDGEDSQECTVLSSTTPPEKTANRSSVQPSTCSSTTSVFPALRLFRAAEAGVRITEGQLMTKRSSNTKHDNVTTDINAESRKGTVSCAPSADPVISINSCGVHVDRPKIWSISEIIQMDRPVSSINSDHQERPSHTEGIAAVVSTHCPTVDDYSCASTYTNNRCDTKSSNCRFSPGLSACLSTEDQTESQHVSRLSQNSCITVMSATPPTDSVDIANKRVNRQTSGIRLTDVHFTHEHKQQQHLVSLIKDNVNKNPSHSQIVSHFISNTNLYSIARLCEENLSRYPFHFPCEDTASDTNTMGYSNSTATSGEGTHQGNAPQSEALNLQKKSESKEVCNGR